MQMLFLEIPPYLLLIFAVFYILSAGMTGFLPKNRKEAEAIGILLAYIVAIVVTVIYFIFPIDLIPDAAIGIGQVDDIGIGVLAFTMATALAQSMTASPRKK